MPLITAAQARAEAVRDAADMVGHAIVDLVRKLRRPRHQDLCRDRDAD
jgi:hypothetical protein